MMNPAAELAPSNAHRTDIPIARRKLSLTSHGSVFFAHCQPINHQCWCLLLSAVFWRSLQAMCHAEAMTMRQIL